MDRFVESDTVFEIGQREAEELGTAWSLPLWHFYRADLRLAEHMSWALAVVQEASGDSASALDTLAPVCRALPERLLLLAKDPWAAPHTVRIAMSVGATSQAEVVVEAARRLAGMNPSVASLAGAAAHAEGLLRGDLGQLRAAVQAYRSSPRRLAAASAIEDAAKAEQAAGHRSQAVELLEEALGHYTDTSARRDEARVQRRLRRLGVRRRSPAQVRPKFGWSSMTEAELRVARLVADGLTNREVAAQLFLSPHTVDSHLRHAFSKLGISSRVELTRQILAQPEDNGQR